MQNRTASITVAGLLLLLSVGPAFAGITPRALPEPMTMTLFGLGVGGAFLAKKLFGRK